MHFGVMDVILLHSSHQHVTAMSAQSISWTAVHYTDINVIQQSGSYITTCIFNVPNSTHSKQQFLPPDILYSSLFYFIIQPWILTKSYIIFKLWSDSNTF
jgi:hypothetical protein